MNLNNNHTIYYKNKLIRDKKDSIINNPLIFELAKILKNTTITENLEKIKKDDKYYVIDELSKEEKKKLSRQKSYINTKMNNYINGILKRFILLDRNHQMEVIVQLNNIFNDNTS
jgi:hypothetical protein